MDFLYIIDIIGTFVFAISGTMAASEKKMDVFGAFIFASVTAIGGGTIRDLLIGSLPVGWMKDLNYLIVILLGLLFTMFFKKTIKSISKTIFLFDTIGIGAFTVLGLQKTLALGLHPMIAILMGTCSAVFGGVVRDVLANRIPLIFRKEIYATACLGGGLLYVSLHALDVPTYINVIVSIISIIVIRILSVLKGWALPKI